MLTSESSVGELVSLLPLIRKVPGSNFVPDFPYYGFNYSWLLSSHEGKYRSVSIPERFLNTGAVSQCRSGVSIPERCLNTGAASQYPSSVSIPEQCLNTGALSQYLSGVSMSERRLNTGAVSQYRSSISIPEQCLNRSHFRLLPHQYTLYLSYTSGQCVD